MSAHLGGAKRKLQDKLDRTIPYIPCKGHCCNTIAEQSVNKSAIVSNLLSILEELQVILNPV